MVNFNPDEFTALPEPARRRLAGVTLTQVKTWLKVADLEQPEPVVDFRAVVVEITKQARNLYLGQETLLDLQEIARRCERWIAAAIKLGQRQRRIRDKGHRRGGTTVSPEMVAKQGVSGSLSAYYALFTASDAAFERAVITARQRGSLSQGSLMRIIQDSQGYVPVGLARHRQQIAELAKRNYTSQQISEVIGIRVDIVSRYARDAGIDIPANRVARVDVRHADAARIINETVNSLEGLVMGCELLDFQDLSRIDPVSISAWQQSLTVSLKTLSTLRKEIRRVEHTNRAVTSGQETDGASQRDSLGGVIGDESLTSRTA